ncbi:MAG: GAP family protein [Acidimicrobiales bacterium]
MGELLTKIIPLAIGAAFSPTVIALELLIVSGKRSKQRATLFLFGILSVFGAITVLGLVLSHTSSASPAQESITKTVDAAAGVFLLLLGLGTILRSIVHESVPPIKGDTKDTSNPGLLSAFVLGLAIMFTNFSTILLYIPAMRSISASEISDTDKTLAVLIVFFIATAPILFVYGFAVGFPNVAGPPLNRLRTWIDRHQRTISISIEFLFGTFLLFKAFR